ncbi:MAG TPA: DUF192 domain-containing protein, partial [Candidatus Baltobacteraceae bacterium]|nr:DUF192 domain-containing protein [Candidatus Baltobacteraceae bacterium]
MTGRLLDADSRRVLVPYVVRAVGPFARAIGLLGQNSLEPDAAMWFDRCAAIHTLGMRMTIDVVFLDARGAVLSAQAGVRPWRPV